MLTQPKFHKKKDKNENISKLIQQSKEEMEKIQKDCQDDIDATNFTNEQLNEQRCKLHKCMDNHLEQIDAKLRAHLQQRNIEKYIQLFSAAIEQATAEFGQLDSDSYQRIAGRSKTNIKNVKDSKSPIFLSKKLMISNKSAMLKLQEASSNTGG